jgi:uncharacterized sulfatase
MKKFVLLLTVAFFVFSATAQSHPNILFVLIDDMGYADLSCYGDQRIKTKNIDRVAREGIRFAQYYVNAPMCSASRTALLTGQFPARWRITSYLADRKLNEQRGMAQWLDPSAPSLARALQQNGYATGHFGKWHMGGQRDVGDAPLITEYGFDKSLTQFEGLGDRILPLLDDFSGKPAHEYALGSEKLGRGKITWVTRSKVTGTFVDHAIAFMKEAHKSGKPFYVNVWPDDVHSPFFPPKELRGNNRKKQLYLGVTKAMDEQFAALFNFVRNDPALRTNTIILIASDNGPEPGAGSAKPFRGFKGNLYEGGVREPLIVWAPGFIDSKLNGTTNKKTVIAGIDFFPSLAGIAKLKLPENLSFDGENLSDSLLGKKEQTRTRPLMWIRPPDRAGRGKERWPDLSIRDGDWKLLLMEDGSNAQLYDVATDLGEAHNVASVHPDIVQKLSKKLLAWRKTLPVPKSVLNPLN